MLIRLGLVVASVVLTYFSFPNILFIEGFPALAWGALVPFLAALEGRPWRERLGLGTLWGGLAFFLLTRWMLDVSVGGFVSFAAVLAVSPVVFSLLAAAPFRSPAGQLCWWPCAWVVSEWLRMILLGGFVWSLAYSQAFVPAWIQFATFGGAFSVVWLLVLVNSAIWLAIKTRGGHRLMFFVAAVVLFMVNWLAGYAREQMDTSSGPKMRVALIQPNIARRDKTDISKYDLNIAKHLFLTQQAAVRRPELIVWPETAFPDDLLRDAVFRPQLESFAKEYQAYWLIGSALDQDGQGRNAALLLSPEGAWVGAYSKMRLIPFTEYLPRDAGSRWLAGLFNIRPYDFTAGKGLGIFSFTGGKKAWSGREGRFGVVICSEEAYPQLFRQLVRRQAGFVVVMLNDGWFYHKEALWMHAQNAVFRAVESGVSIVRVANTGLTLALDFRGMAVKADGPAMQSEGYGVMDLPLFRQQTPYAIWGDFFAWLCVGFVIIIYGFQVLKRR